MAYDECASFRQSFTAYDDGDLGKDTARRLEHHLAVCPECAREWQHFAATIGLLHGLEPAMPPADLLPGIHRKLEAHNTSIAGRLRRLARALDLRLSLSTAVATIFVGLIAFAVIQSGPGDSTSPLPGALQASRQSAGDLAGSHLPSQTARIEQPRMSWPATSLVALKPAGELPLAGRAPSSHPVFADLAYVVRCPTADHRSALYHRLLTDPGWRISDLQGNKILLLLNHERLPRLQKTLEQYGQATLPAGGVQALHAPPKKVLTVAIHFQ